MSIRGVTLRIVVFSLLAMFILLPFAQTVLLSVTLTLPRDGYETGSLTLLNFIEVFKRPDLRASIDRMVREVQGYVPGYTLNNAPIIDGNRVTISVEVEGLGDFLPKYAGNLDIMTAAGLRTAEMMAQRQQREGSPT